MARSFRVEMSNQLVLDLTKIAICTDSSLDDVLRKALTLFVLAHEAHEKGLTVAFINKSSGAVETSITGF